MDGNVYYLVPTVLSCDEESGREAGYDISISSLDLAFGITWQIEIILFTHKEKRNNGMFTTHRDTNRDLQTVTVTLLRFISTGISKYACDDGRCCGYSRLRLETVAKKEVHTARAIMTS